MRNYGQSRGAGPWAASLAEEMEAAFVADGLKNQCQFDELKKTKAVSSLDHKTSVDFLSPFANLVSTILNLFHFQVETRRTPGKRTPPPFPEGSMMPVMKNVLLIDVDPSDLASSFMLSCAWRRRFASSPSQRPRMAA